MSREPSGYSSKSAKEIETLLECIKTRPQHVQTKAGASGEKVALKANCFPIDELADLDFNQYRVDFEPELELINVRKALVGKHISSFGGEKFYLKKYLSSNLKIFYIKFLTLTPFILRLFIRWCKHNFHHIKAPSR